VNAHVTIEELIVWRARCHEAGCRWHYENVVKTDVNEQARNHRGHHRHADQVLEEAAAAVETDHQP
jgi:hypothetical protein